MLEVLPNKNKTEIAEELPGFWINKHNVETNLTTSITMLIGQSEAIINTLNQGTISPTSLQQPISSQSLIWEKHKVHSFYYAACLLKQSSGLFLSNQDMDLRYAIKEKITPIIKRNIQTFMERMSQEGTDMDKIYVEKYNSDESIEETSKKFYLEKIINSAQKLELKDLPEIDYNMLFTAEYAKSNLPQYHVDRIIKIAEEIVNTYCIRG